MQAHRLPGIGLALGVLMLLVGCAPTAPVAPAAPVAPTAPPPPPTTAPAPKPTQVAATAKPAEQAGLRKEGPSFTFKFAATAPESDLSGVGYKYWAQLVDERTGGRIKFRFFWAGSLLISQQQFQGIRDGLADFGGPSMATISGQVADVAPFEVPFGYPTDLQFTIPFYREVEPVLNEIFSAGFNQRVVYASPSTTPDPVTCRDKFLDSPRAWQGALVRSAGKWQGRTMELWGAKPVVIDASEAYTAIQRGTADCLLFVYNLLDSFKIYEVAKYLTRVDHSINLQVVSANLDAWNQLPPEDQQILIDAGRETQEYLVQQRSDLVTKTIEKFKAQGVKVCTPPQEELVRLRNATDPVLEEIAALQTEKGRKLQEIARAYRAKVTRWGPSEGDLTPCPGAG